MTDTRVFLPTPSGAVKRWLDRTPSFGLLDHPTHPRDLRGDEIDRLGLAGEDDDR